MTGNRPQVQALFEQFPWLHDHFNVQTISYASLSEVSPHLLQRKPEDLGSIFWIAYEKLLLLNSNGKELIKVGVEDLKWWDIRWVSQFSSKRHFEETVLGALFRLGEQIKEVHFIISGRPNNLEHTAWTLTVYKLPEDFDLVEQAKQVWRHQFAGIYQF